jgi:lysyl-tRNA synthetase, class II
VSRSMTFRQSAALGVAAVGIETLLSAATPNDAHRQRIIGRLAPPALPSVAHLLALVAGLALLLLVPKLWRGTRTAVSVAIAVLGILAVLNILKGLDFDEAALNVSVAMLLALGRGAFPLGCRNRPQLAAVCAAVGAWALTYCALLVKPLASDRGHTIKQALRASLAHPRLSETWLTLVEALLGCAVLISLLAVRSLLRPAAGRNGHEEHEYRAARAIVERYGNDSISPFTLRPDKAFHFAAGGVLAYRVIGETAVVSGDPVAPSGAAPRVLLDFIEHAHERGWNVVLWGASPRHLDSYRELGLHAVCLGEEAFVDPAQFTLDGRRVRKLRQSVHRLQRRGWEIEVCDGRQLDSSLEAEIDALEAAWRARQRRIIGFAMGMGQWEPDRKPSDLYLLARSPERELRAAMRFVDHCGALSLDTMRRGGQTPNGLNEALIARALEIARKRGVPEVSLNYAGLGHLIRGSGRDSRAAGRLARCLSRLLGRRFQMARLVRFDEKFLPEWRPRFLICESRAALPMAGLRVLQAEGYLPQRGTPRLRPPWRPGQRALPGSPQADAAP